MMQQPQTQRQLAQALLRERGMMRLAELRQAGITAATMSRMRQAGEVFHVAHGVYQLIDADIEAFHSYAEAATRKPKGVICLVSALVFHEITLERPAKVWMAIGRKDWAPTGDGVKIQPVRFADHLLEDGYETHTIEGVPVKVFSITSTLADCFRHLRHVELSVAIEGLQETLRQHKAKPGDIAAQAIKRGSYHIMHPYLEALVANA